MSNIILLGMPGVGKSTIGRLLALKTNRPFLDTDEYILSTTGKDVSEHIYGLPQETTLRREIDLISDAEIYSGVIALSGSVPITERGKILIRQWWSVVIELKIDPEILKIRIEKRSDGDTRIIFWKSKDLNELLSARQEHFDDVRTHQIQCNKSPDEIVDDILEIMNSYTQ